MKSGIPLLAAFIISINSFAQSGESLKFPKDFVLVPLKETGETIQAFYIRNEITNKQFREFVNYLKQHPNDNLFKNVSLDEIIDTAAMNKDYDHYFTNKAYDNYAVIGVTENGKNLYCNWITAMKGKNVQLFRVPLPAEFDYASSFKNIGDNSAMNNSLHGFRIVTTYLEKEK